MTGEVVERFYTRSSLSKAIQYDGIHGNAELGDQIVFSDISIDYITFGTFECIRRYPRASKTPEMSCSRHASGLTRKS